MDQENYSENPQIDVWVKLRDIEERQRLLRDRLLLVGKNMIEAKEETEKNLGKLKRDVVEIKEDILKLKDILSTLSEELSNSAKKSEIMILERQLGMFSPLELARIQDVEKIIDEKLKKKN